NFALKFSATCAPFLPKRGLPSLAELDGYRFRVRARRTFKGPLVVIILFGRFDARKKHWQSALRASPLSNRRLCYIEVIRMRHGALPHDTGGSPTGLSVTDACRQSLGRG